MLPAALLVACWFPGVASVAPPGLTSLFPAGAQRGTTATVTASGSFEAWPVRVWTSDTALAVASGNEKGKLRIAVAPNATPGVAWLRLFNAAGASPPRPFIIGVLPDVAEVEPNDDTAKPQAVSLPAVVNGKLAKNGDVDCFAVRLTRGQTLVASVEAHHTLRSPMDSILQILAADGTVLEQNHDRHGLDPQIAFAAPHDGTFLVRLFAFPSQPDSSIRHFGSEACVYRLALTAGAFVDSATPLAVEKGKEAKLALRGWNLKSPTHALAASAEFALPPDGANGVRVLREPHACYEGVPASPPAPPFTMTLRTPANASFLAAKGTPVTLRVESAFTASVRVDAGEKPIANAESSDLHGACEVTFAPPEGVCRVRVQDLSHTEGPHAVYLLRVVPAQPDFAPSASADRFTLTAGQPLDVTVALRPKNGFKDELAWSAEGLPEGVAVQATSPTVLRFTAKDAGFSGPIRLVATSKTAPKLRRTAAAKLAPFDVETTDLWLTVVPPPAKK